MLTMKRPFIAAGALGLMLAIAGCGKTDQQKAQEGAETARSGTQAAGQQVKTDVAKLGEDVKTGARSAGGDLKAIAKDPEVKKAAGELKGSLKDLGKAVKEASKKDKSEANATSEASKN